ncbi:MAG: hypothetical protein IJS93_01060 [Clostridia bacterium]|nr:hypothetical protein [Clostridia bacterium]
MSDIEKVENNEVEAAEDTAPETAEDTAAEAPAEEAAADDKKDAKKKKGYVHPVIAWTCIGLAAAIVLFVGLFVAKTLV